MDWSIQEIAKIAGTTSRTLRHYGDIGLLPPPHRPQRLPLLRPGRARAAAADPAAARARARAAPIGEVLDRRDDAGSALTGHLAWLRQEQDRLARQIVSVQLTIDALRGGERLMAEDMFDGFDHTQYKDEVEERWGKKAYADSDRWWRGMSADEKAAWKQRSADLGRDWIAAAESGIAPDSAEAQALARRHVEWLTGIRHPGTPAAGSRRRAGRQGVRHRPRRDVRRRPRFGANYGGDGGSGASLRDRDAPEDLRREEPVAPPQRERTASAGQPANRLGGD